MNDGALALATGSRFADRVALGGQLRGRGSTSRRCAETAGFDVPQARDLAGDIHDLGADARQLGLPALRFIIGDRSEAAIRASSAKLRKS